MNLLRLKPLQRHTARKPRGCRVGGLVVRFTRFVRSSACSDRLTPFVYRRSPHFVRLTVARLPRQPRPFQSRPA